VVRSDWLVEYWNWEKRCCELTVRLKDVVMSHQKFVGVAAVSVDRTLLVACERLGLYATVWNMKTGESVAILAGHALPVTAMAFSPDAASVATGDEGGLVRVWSTVSGDCILTLEGHKKVVTALAWAQLPLCSQSLLASASLDCSVRLWGDPHAGAGAAALVLEPPEACRTHQVQAWELAPDAVFSLDLSADGEQVAGGMLSGHVVVWGARKGENRFAIDGHRASVRQVAFSPSGGMLATCAFEEGSVMLWTVEEQSLGLLRAMKIVSLQSLLWLSDEFVATSQSFPHWSMRLWDLGSTTIQGGPREIGKREMHDSAIALLVAPR